MNVSIDRLKTIVTSNISLLVVIFGALSNFLLILFFKKYLPEYFNSYSLYITYLGIITAYGLIGLDQVFLRLSKSKDEKILIGKDLLFFIVISSVLVPGVMAYYFSLKYLNLNMLPLILSGISINVIIITYNLLRLQKKFVFSQLFHSGYKIAFLIAIFVFYLTSKTSIHTVINLSTVILVFFGIIAFFYIFKTLIPVSKKTASLLNFFLSFSINLMLLTALTYGERIFIANELGEDVFGKYFYYSTVFLFPLTLIQYYVGFKELVFFKSRIEKKIVHSKLKKIFFLGLFLITAIFLVVFIDQGYFLEIELKDNLAFIILLSVLGIVKLSYGLFSAVLGAKGEFKDIYLINLFTVTLIGISLLLLSFSGITLNYVISCLIVIFVFRAVFVYYKYVH